jgi:hypothetical protein
VSRNNSWFSRSQIDSRIKVAVNECRQLGRCQIPIVNRLTSDQTGKIAFYNGYEIIGLQTLSKFTIIFAP